MSFFAPKASTSAKFHNVGDTVSGTISEISDPMQARKYDDGSPDFWPSGDPVMQVKVTLDTSQRDPQITDDDGKRALWVKQSSQVLYAIQNALKAAGADDLKVGGFLTVTYSGDDPNSKNPRNPKKLYQARYEGPVAAGGMFANDPANRFEHPQNPPQPQTQQGGYGQQNPWDGNQQTQGGNYADSGQYAPGGANTQQGYGQQPPAPQAPQGPQQQAQQPQAPALTPELETNIKALIGMGMETGVIVNSLANPAVTAQTVDALRA